MSEKYWCKELGMNHPFGFRLEWRSTFAQELLKHFGVIAGMPNGEDKSGRAILDLQQPKELVARAFAIADVFFDTAESRGDIKGVEVTDDEQAAHEGKLARIRLHQEFERDKTEK